MTQPFRNLNSCPDCGHSWHPRGHAVSRRCPECGCKHVIVHEVERSSIGFGGLAVVGLFVVGLLVFASTGSNGFNPEIAKGRALMRETVKAELILRDNEMKRIWAEADAVQASCQQRPENEWGDGGTCYNEFLEAERRMTAESPVRHLIERTTEEWKLARGLQSNGRP